MGFLKGPQKWVLRSESSSTNVELKSIKSSSLEAGPCIPDWDKGVKHGIEIQGTLETLHRGTVRKIFKF